MRNLSVLPHGENVITPSTCTVSRDGSSLVTCARWITGNGATRSMVSEEGPFLSLVTITSSHNISHHHRSHSTTQKTTDYCPILSFLWHIGCSFYLIWYGDDRLLPPYHPATTLFLRFPHVSMQRTNAFNRVPIFNLLRSIFEILGRIPTL